MRDDARAGLELIDEARLQLADELGQEVHGNHACLREIGEQDIALNDAHALGHTGASRVLARELGELLVELDAQATRAVLARRRDDDAAIARAQIRYEVA